MLQKLIKLAIKNKVKSEKELSKIKRKFARDFNTPIIPNSEIITAYKKLLAAGKIKKNPGLENLLRKRQIRTLSGVAVITVLTKPFPCPGTCIYCPSEPNMPKSYLSNEPAAMRAVLNKFNPYTQVQNRIRALEANGHEVDKIELIVLGGTWSFYPKNYQTEFIKECFRGANEYSYASDNSRFPYPPDKGGARGGFNKNKNFKTKSGNSLKEQQKINETTRYRIIGISLETRPDHVNEEEVKRLRELGCTRVQLGVQHLDDKILKLVKRGHYTADLIKATKLLKDAGFKVDYHLMPNLPGSTPAKDLKMFERIFGEEEFRPDQLKIYPCIVNEYAKLYKWYKSGKYKPYSPKVLMDLMVKIKKTIPYHVRINRVIRDIPEESIIAGNKTTNLREYLKKELERQKVQCKCIRCREARNKKVDLKNTELFIEKYPASGGWEYFLSYENKDRTILYAFVRLRLPDKKEVAKHFIPELKTAALLRELHTYGQLVRVGAKSKDKKVQHEGFGKKLMREAEEIAKKNGYKKMAVISGIGVREYYKKLGYEPEGTYMVKDL